MSNCTGCGFCCLKATCSLGSGTRCAYLNWDGKRYVCLLMIGDNPQAWNARKQLAAGEGCCCGLNTWRKEVKYRG